MKPDRWYSMLMATATDRIPKDLVNDFRRNREGRLSTRQWLELITEPVISLLLLSVPMILLVGRYGMAGRMIVLALVGGFLLTIAVRAIRFARVKLVYRVLFVENLQPRWRFWRKTVFASRSGESVQFDHKVASKMKIKSEQALHVYYVSAGKRRILVSMIPQEHPKAELAEPSDDFVQRGGTVFAD